MLKPHIFTPEIVLDESTVIVTTNHLGASIYGPTAETFGDSGKDAQHLANASGCRVIGLDRPHTGNNERYDKQTAHHMRTQPEIVAAEWIKAAQPAITETGASQVQLVGRSAGANLLLEVALLELLPLTAILTIDPVAILKMPVWRGKLRYAEYQIFTDRKKVDQPQNESISISELVDCFSDPDRPLTSLRRMIARQRQDIKQYQASWATENGFLAAALIAAKLRQTTARFAFAGYPLSGERQQLEPKIAALNGLRRVKPDRAPVISEFIAGTVHSSFDTPKNYIAEYYKLQLLDESYRATLGTSL